MVSGASSAPRAMSAWGRVALIAVLTLAFAATIYGGQQLTGWLMRVVKIPTSGYVSYDEIVAISADAWNKLIDQPWRIMSIGLRKWAHEC